MTGDSVEWPGVARAPSGRSVPGAGPGPSQTQPPGQAHSPEDPLSHATITPDEPAATVRLLDDPATADLRAKVDAAWQEFARAVADAVTQLPPGVQLDLTLDPTASGTGDAVYEVTVWMGEDRHLYAEAVSNASLPDGNRLDRIAIANLVALGWSPPGVVEQSRMDRFGMRVPHGAAPLVAATVTRTLWDVYGAPHPAFITYEVTGTRAGAEALLKGAAEGTVELPPLGTARPAPVSGVSIPQDSPVTPAAAPVDYEFLMDRVRTVIATLQGLPSEALHPDEDGDIGIRAGSAMVFVRVHRNPPLVDVYSPLLTEVKPNERLYERLSQLTRRLPIGRLYYTEGTVWASVPVFGRDFASSHLVLAVQVMTALADELDDRLQGEFGGRRFFGEDKPPGDTERTGMYL